MTNIDELTPVPRTEFHISGQLNRESRRFLDFGQLKPILRVASGKETSRSVLAPLLPTMRWSQWILVGTAVRSKPLAMNCNIAICALASTLSTDPTPNYLASQLDRDSI
jgi:hypothetical protein